MARRRRQNTRQQEADPIPRKLLKHAEELEFSSFDEYRSWCRQHDFPAGTDKDWSSLEAERAARAAEFKTRSRKRRLASQPRRTIELVCKGELTAEEVTSPRLRPICELVERSNTSPGTREALLRLFLFVERKADFLFDRIRCGNQTYELAAGLIALNDRRGQWLRPLEDWRVKSHNARKQFSSLLRHLLVRYDVPLFMDSAWLRRDQGSYRMRDWFLLIGNGGSLRKESTPIPLTKSMTHHFMQTPAAYSIEGAFRWGQVHALGGDRRLSDALVATRLGDSFENGDFWQTVIRFLAHNPMLDRVHVGPIVDYLQNQRFERRWVFTAPGVREEQPPPQPNLSMRGRRVETLLRQVDAWHDELGRVNRTEGLRWEASGIPPLEFQAGTQGKSLRSWRTRELLSSEELYREGRAMHHCVGSYAASCARGACSVWALEVEDFQGLEKLQTVEVNRHKVIVQSRGCYNRLPNQQEFEMLNRWAQQAGLEISGYVTVE